MSDRIQQLKTTEQWTPKNETEHRQQVPDRHKRVFQDLRQIQDAVNGLDVPTSPDFTALQAQVNAMQTQINDLIARVDVLEQRKTWDTV